ncbi:MAG: hypothetical protein AB1641_19680 [Thermodesulfobacteriota bacterium]
METLRDMALAGRLAQADQKSWKKFMADGVRGAGGPPGSGGMPASDAPALAARLGVTRPLKKARKR